MPPTNAAHRIALEEHPQPKDMNTVIQGLTEYNRLHTNGELPEYLLVTLRDDQGAVLGGLVGATYLGWLQVHSVWLPDALRGRGYGTELMAIAEREAVRRGCRRSLLETYSFQALPFYEARGYAVSSRLVDCPVGGARYLLTKDLSDAA